MSFGRGAAPPSFGIRLDAGRYAVGFFALDGQYLSGGRLAVGHEFLDAPDRQDGRRLAYTYGAHQVRGFKQTHQPSPWINDYGQFSLMPVRGEDKFDEESRASWFSHQSEVAKPYYYKTYLADHDIRVEITPTDRAAMMRFTFPESTESGVVIDAFDRGSQVGMVDDRTIVGYTTRNSGGVPENFRNWFVVRFDTPFAAFELTDAPADTNPAATCSIPKGRSPSRANMPWQGAFRDPPRPADMRQRGVVVHFSRTGAAEPPGTG